MAPVLEDIATRLESLIKVAKVDTDKSPKLGNRYQIESLPTLILFYKGEAIERFVGYKTANELESEIKTVRIELHYISFNSIQFNLIRFVFRC